jgi:CheY-specific phosphatase CheX
MQTSTQAQLSSTFLEVVEQLTFMFGEEIPKDELGAEGKEFVSAAMKFKGDMVGELTVAVPMDITVEIAANILGLEPEEVEPEYMRRDALAEMLNVVCGHVIMALVGADANFKLDAPVTDQVDEDAFNRMMLSEDFIGFMLDDNPVFLGLSLEN